MSWLVATSVDKVSILIVLVVFVVVEGDDAGGGVVGCAEGETSLEEISLEGEGTGVVGCTLGLKNGSIGELVSGMRGRKSNNKRNI